MELLLVLAPAGDGGLGGAAEISRLGTLIMGCVFCY